MKYSHNPKAEKAFRLLEEVLSTEIDEDLDNFIKETDHILKIAVEIKNISKSISSGSYDT